MTILNSDDQQTIWRHSELLTEVAAELPKEVSDRLVEFEARVGFLVENQPPELDDPVVGAINTAPPTLEEAAVIFREVYSYITDNHLQSRMRIFMRHLEIEIPRQPPGSGPQGAGAGSGGRGSTR